MTDTACICCPIYRPGAAAHIPTLGPVCRACRSRIHRDAFAVARLHHDLVAGDTLVVDGRLVEVVDDDGHPTGAYRWADPTAALLPAGTVAARSGQPVVSGSRAYSTPIDIDTIDLTAPARPHTVRDAYRDQTGHISAATLLDSWVHAFRIALFATEARPEPTVYALVRWLTTGAPTSRLDTACTHYPAITDFAGELRQLCAALRGAAGETEPAPQVLLGVPCRGCNLVSQLVRDGDYIECGTCGLLLTDAEYRAWTTVAAQQARTPPTPPAPALADTGADGDGAGAASHEPAPTTDPHESAAPDGETSSPTTVSPAHLQGDL